MLGLMFNELTKSVGLSLERLISFCEVAKAGSIARAADGSESRQSQYSRQIKELEEFFGVELTKKDKRSKESGLLTVHGEKLREVAQQGLGALEDFALQVTAGKTRCRLAAGNSLLTWFIIPLIAKHRQQFSDIEFNLTDMDTADILNALRAREIDIGLVRTKAIEPPLLESSSIYKLSYVVAAPKGWGAKLLKDASLLPFAVIESSEQLGELRRAVQKNAKKAKIIISEKYVCRDACQCLEFVRNGEAAAIVPEIARLEDLDVVRVPWLKNCDRKLSFVRHKDLSGTKLQVFNILEGLLPL